MTNEREREREHEREQAGSAELLPDEPTSGGEASP